MPVTAARERATDEGLAWFVKRMRRKLDMNAHKPVWHDISTAKLVWLMLVEVGELLAALACRAPAEAVIDEAADVGNYSMMLADNLRRRTP